MIFSTPKKVQNTHKKFISEAFDLGKQFSASAQAFHLLIRLVGSYNRTGKRQIATNDYFRNYAVEEYKSLAFSRVMSQWIRLL